MSTERLYGLPGDEYLHTDPEDVLERWVDDHYADDPVTLPEIIEWDTVPTRDHLPNSDLLLEWVAEWTAENGEVFEEGYDNVANAGAAPEVIAVAEALLDLIAERITFRMANRELGTLKVTLADDRTLLLDGEPTDRRLPTAEELAPVSNVADRIRRLS